jgi:hypothetical protein
VTWYRPGRGVALISSGGVPGIRVAAVSSTSWGNSCAAAVLSPSSPRAIRIERKNMIILSMEVIVNLKETLFYSRVY